MKSGISSKKIEKRLRSILRDEPNTLRAEVAQEALENDDPEMFFEDLFSHGCVSGMVGKLCYYSDTHAFYDKYYDEIEDIRLDMEESIGQPLRIKDDLKNTLAWLGFEETAWVMADELGLCY